MSELLSHSLTMTDRDLRRLVRQPWWIVVSLIQPVVWLLLFGPLFKNIANIPGFKAPSYIQFLTPGVVIMTAFFSGGWNGMATIDDVNRGVVDRLLVSPLRRSSFFIGHVLQTSVTIIIQVTIIVLLAYALGAHYSNGLLGVLVMFVAAVLLGGALNAASNGLALIFRREETLIATLNVFMLPLTFLSTAFMQKSMIPHWIQVASRYNPLNWAVVASREAISSGTDWGSVGTHLGLLAGLLVVCMAFAMYSIRVYQRSI
ncbi:MAG TPA: ABC transporter permease [Gaiellaceae bacterium]|jgi:ABC-2 type transport system permease protein